MSEIILGVRLQPSQFQRIKLDNIVLTNNVDSLKVEAAQKINVQPQNIELVYCGLVLNDNASLASCGIKPGVMVHVLEKRKPSTPPSPRKLTKSDLQKLAVAFRSCTYTPGYRAALQRLSRVEVLDNIIASTPGLADDPVAIAMLRDPELIVQMSDPETVRRTADLHPSLIEAAQQIAAHVHEEATNAATTTAPSTSTGYSYSLEALSDDEEMDSASTTPREGQPIQRNSSYNAITAAQLASAIANATTSTFGFSTSAANAPSSSPNVITSEMFTSAMQQAFATAGGTSPATPTRPEGGEAFETPIRNRFQSQLQQMEEMGLRNVAINTRALQATSGDVQAAVELVLSGAFD